MKDEYIYILVINPGTDEEKSIDEFKTHTEAMIHLKKLIRQGIEADIMKRMNDGTLTTEF